MRTVHICVPTRKERVKDLKTLIEIYDEESVFNLITTCAAEPQTVVMLGGERLSDETLRSRQRGFLAKRGINTKIAYKICDVQDCSSIIEALAEITEEYMDCVIDVSGGGDLALVACGMFAESCDIPIMRLDEELGCFADVRDFPEAEKLRMPVFSIEDMIAMTGAGVVRNGRISAKDIDDELRRDTFALWDIFTEYRSSWHKTTQFFHSADEKSDDNLQVETRTPLPIDKNYCPPALLRRLAENGLITDYESSREKVRFRYKSQTMRSILRDKGSVLELMTYCRMSESGFFDDVDISVVIDWDGRGDSSTTNEIDVMAVRGLVTYFISCKSARADNLSSEYLYEIDTMAHRLGGRFAQPVLVTAVSNIRSTAQPMWERAHDMRVIIADQMYLQNGKLGELLANYKRKPPRK